MGSSNSAGDRALSVARFRLAFVFQLALRSTCAVLLVQEELLLCLLLLKGALTVAAAAAAVVVVVVCVKSEERLIERSPM